jgi:hypothetical protein
MNEDTQEITVPGFKAPRKTPTIHRFGVCPCGAYLSRLDRRANALTDYCWRCSDRRDSYRADALEET